MSAYCGQSLHERSRPRRRPGADRLQGIASARWLPRWLAVTLLLIAATPASGQELRLKTALQPEAAEFCARVDVGAAVAPGSDAAVDSLLAAGSRAAILGDHYRAGELLLEASKLAPANAVIAYRLARTYEERGEPELALNEYCRAMAISPQAPDATEVRERIRQLVSSATAVDREELAATVGAGIEAYENRRYAAASLAFDRVVGMRPEWAAAYFNRGITSLTMGRTEEAVPDLEHYLELLPAADDRAAVQARIDSLRQMLPPSPVLIRSRTPPGEVFARGLVLPGLGQLSTGRPLMGALVLGGTSAAIVWALREEQVTRTRTAQDPFGNPYDFEVRVRERTHLVPGIGAAAAIAVIGAIEAYAVARGRTTVVRLDPGGGDGVIAVLHPHLSRSGYGLSVDLRLPAPH